jgi:chemotaxis protein histidine kinase CheA
MLVSALLLVATVAAAAGPSVVELTGLPSSCELRHGGAAGIESTCALHVNGVDVVARLTALQTELTALELDQSGMEKTVKAQEASLSDHGDELDALEKESKAFLKTHTDTAAAFNTDLSLLNSHINAAQVAAKAAQKANADVAAVAHQRSSENAVAHAANKKAQEDALSAVSEAAAKSHVAAELARDSNAAATAQNDAALQSNNARLANLESERASKETAHKEATVKYTAQAGRRLLTSAQAAAMHVAPVPAYKKDPSQWHHESTSARDCEITLVTQCSIDRLPALRRQMTSWTNGKMSVALYIPGGVSARSALESEADALLQDAARSGVDLTLSVLTDVNTSDGKYPINSLRNLALGQVNTPLVFLVDVDFIVSAGFVQWAKVHHAEIVDQCDIKQQALVVPAFEYHTSTDTAAPTTMAGLAGEWAAQRASAFHVATFPEGHGSTNYNQWWKQSSTMRTTPAAPAAAYPIEFAGHYEPYIIAAARHVPAYDERLRGYGMNKVAHLQAMHLLRKAPFKVLLDQFVIAHEHERSAAFDALHANVDSVDELQSVFSKVVEELSRGVEPTVHESTRAMLLK